MISGIGVDLVDKARFINLVKKFGNRVATKILSKDEYLEYKNISNKPSFLSKRFAAKEALSKALGFGLYRKGIYPKYISVKHDDFGKPFLSLSTELETIINNHNMKIQLSITDSDTQSIAFVVIESWVISKIILVIHH